MIRPMVGDPVFDVSDGVLGIIITATLTHGGEYWVTVCFGHRRPLQFWGFDLEEHPAEDGCWLIDSTVLDDEAP